jgi:hypothetical protein
MDFKYLEKRGFQYLSVKIQPTDGYDGGGFSVVAADS